jgi:molybdopterin molybdotransferase
VKPGQNVRLRGEDVSDGERVLQAGQVLDINARTLLHAIGVGEVAVVARPKAAVIATGKELVTEAAQTLESGQIRDSNRPYLVGRLQAAGAEVVWQGTVGDEVAAFNAVLDEALDAGAQLLISTGAVSAGRYDFIPDALRGRVRASCSTRWRSARASRCCSRCCPMARCISACRATRCRLRWASASSSSRCCAACWGWHRSRC